MTIEELFGTLQQSVVSTWRKHLRTAKYSKHMALDKFYNEMPEKVDALIEAWMGANGKKIKSYDNILQSKNMNTLSYLKELRKVVKQGYALMDGEAELEAKLDDIVELIDSTLYKVKELSESKVMNLKDFITEALVNEANINKELKKIGSLYNDNGDLSAVASCFNWLDEIGWDDKMSAEDYATEVNNINDDIDEDTFEAIYWNCMSAMLTVGRKETLKFIEKISEPDEMDDYGIEK